jgi:hypothetical protein
MHKFLLCVFVQLAWTAATQAQKASFRVLAFYTAQQDAAHISFVHEANRWFPKMAKRHHFEYDSTNDWTRLNASVLKDYQVIIFLDTRPEDSAQRAAFRTYMERGGAWMGFHFAGFALTPSAYNQNWDWYHNEFLGSGQYKSNTWRPVSAKLRLEDRHHPIARHLPKIVNSAPNEWYSWEKDLRENSDIRVLASIDPGSFPLGTGPNPNEIWYSGDYPVIWTNTKFHMLYFNMGHNDIDYEHGTQAELSHQFDAGQQNRLILQGLLWLGRDAGN